MTRTIKKLYAYLYESERIVVDSFEADDWGDFMIVRIKGLGDDAYHVYEEARQAIQELAPGKKFVIVPDGLEIEFYGVEVEDADQ